MPDRDDTYPVFKELTKVQIQTLINSIQDIKTFASEFKDWIKLHEGSENECRKMVAEHIGQYTELHKEHLRRLDRAEALLDETKKEVNLVKQRYYWFLGIMIVAYPLLGSFLTVFANHLMGK